MNQYKLEIEKLFDIASCKCKSKCVCDENYSIPESQREFLNDHRIKRTLKIGTITENTQKNLYVLKNFVTMLT